MGMSAVFPNGPRSNNSNTRPPLTPQLILTVKTDPNGGSTEVLPSDPANWNPTRTWEESRHAGFWKHPYISTCFTLVLPLPHQGCPGRSLALRLIQFPISVEDLLAPSLPPMEASLRAGLQLLRLVGAGMRPMISVNASVTSSFHLISL